MGNDWNNVRRTIWENRRAIAQYRDESDKSCQSPKSSDGPCQNIEDKEECIARANQGHCDTRKVFMEKYCPKACGFCSGKLCLTVCLPCYVVFVQALGPSKAANDKVPRAFTKPERPPFSRSFGLWL